MNNKTKIDNSVNTQKFGMIRKICLIVGINFKYATIL